MPIISAGLLTLFNGLLAFFTWRLWKATSGLWSAAKQQSDDIKQSIIVAKETADAVKTQAETMRQELILTHRPIIRIRNVVTTNFPDKWKIGEPIMGQLYIANTGSTPAKIINVGCWVECLHWGLPMKRPYEEKSPNYPDPFSTQLEAGQSRPLPFCDTRPMGQVVDSIIAGMREYILYVMGYVEYVDNVGTHRRTAFCREYRLPGKVAGEHRETRRFFQVNDPDYEHEE